MSRHEGVSCDSCLKGNFRGRRFKCLICYDYDLCSACFESGVATTRHSASHPMQCILTRSDNDLYFGGEASLASEHQHSFTCPYCSKMGYTESTMQEHVSSVHSEASQEVVCPICASYPGGDPNHVTDDFQGHLNLEHRGGARDLISFLDEPGGGGVHRQGAVRRIAHARGGLTSHRTRRHNNPPPTTGPTSLSTHSPSAARETVDPIAELLSQLTGARRSASANYNSVNSSQLQQLQMELQLQRQQAQAQRQTLDRLTRRPAGGAAATAGGSQQAAVGGPLGGGPGPSVAAVEPVQTKVARRGSSSSLFLLPGLEADDEADGGLEAGESAKKNIFIQELLLSTLSLKNLSLGTSEEVEVAEEEVDCHVKSVGGDSES